MPQIPSRLPREYESPSPDHRTWYTVVVNTVLRHSSVLHLHQRVCHKVGDTMVRTSRFTRLINSREDDKGQKLLLFRPAKRQLEDNLPTRRVQRKMGEVNRFIVNRLHTVGLCPS